MTEHATTPERVVAAPGLVEVAQVWWDVERAPVVTWDASGSVFDLVDPLASSAHRLRLLQLDVPSDDPDGLARVLAEGLAACDFPPTGNGASASKVAATLRAAHRVERVA